MYIYWRTKELILSLQKAQSSLLLINISVYILRILIICHSLQLPCLILWFVIILFITPFAKENTVAIVSAKICQACLLWLLVLGITQGRLHLPNLFLKLVVATQYPFFPFPKNNKIWIAFGICLDNMWSQKATFPNFGCGRVAKFWSRDESTSVNRDFQKGYWGRAGGGLSCVSQECKCECWNSSSNLSLWGDFEL